MVPSSRRSKLLRACKRCCGAHTCCVGASCARCRLWFRYGHVCFRGSTAEEESGLRNNRCIRPHAGDAGAVSHRVRNPLSHTIEQASRESFRPLTQPPGSITGNPKVTGIWARVELTSGIACVIAGILVPEDDTSPQ